MGDDAVEPEAANPGTEDESLPGDDADRPSRAEFGMPEVRVPIPALDPDGAFMRQINEVVRRGMESLQNSPAFQQTLNRIAEQQQRLADQVLKRLQDQMRLAIPEGFFENISRALLPPNLRERSAEISPRKVLAFLKEEGIPLYLVPRASTAVRLLHASDHSARRKILNNCFASIVDDCDGLVQQVKNPALNDIVVFVQDGIGAVRTGHYASAQALFTVTLDTLVSRLYPDRNVKKALTQRKQGDAVPDEIDEMDVIAAYAWLPVWNSHGEFWVHKGDRIPTDYSRHATVHGVSRRQYSKRNCVQSLMLVSSLLGYAEVYGVAA